MRSNGCIDRVNWIAKLDTNQNIYPLFRLKSGNVFKFKRSEKVLLKKEGFGRFHGIHQNSLYTHDY